MLRSRARLLVSFFNQFLVKRKMALSYRRQIPGCSDRSRNCDRVRAGASLGYLDDRVSNSNANADRSKIALQAAWPIQLNYSIRYRVRRLNYASQSRNPECYSGLPYQTES